MSAATVGVARKIAEYVVETNLRDVPAAAVDGAKLTILDTLGVGLVALRLPMAAIIADYVRAQGARPVASILGTAEKTSLPLAALVNGCLFNMVDFDGFSHIPTCTLPAALAVGEERGATGAQALEAYIVGTEVGARVREVFEGRRGEQGGPTFAGWYHVSFHGPIAAAAVACKLLDLSVEQTEAAIGITACGSGGVRANLPSRAKSLLSGNAASNGVQAALLAQAGVTAAPGTIDGPVGLFHALGLADDGEADWTPITEKLGINYTLATFGGSKAFPAVGAVQAALGTLRALIAEHRIRPEDVQSLEAEVSTFTASADPPDSGLTGGFSWPYSLAASLLHGEFGVQRLSEDTFHDPQLRQMMSKVRVIPIEEGRPEHLTLTLQDGRVLKSEVKRQFGRIATKEELEAKYRLGASRHLKSDTVERLYGQVMHLEQAPSIADLTTFLV